MQANNPLMPLSQHVSHIVYITQKDLLFYKKGGFSAKNCNDYTGSQIIHCPVSLVMFQSPLPSIFDRDSLRDWCPSSI